MRAGPLSASSVIKKLNNEFINAWIIIPQFKNPKQFFQNQTARDWAKTIETEFTYPVDSIVLSAKGEVLTQGSFNQVSKTPDYLKMLDSAFSTDSK